MLDIEKNTDIKIYDNEINDVAMDKNKHVLFLTPPYWDVYSPFSAVPSLVAVLKENGIHARQFDLGIK